MGNAFANPSFFNRFVHTRVGDKHIETVSRSKTLYYIESVRAHIWKRFLYKYNCMCKS